MGCGEACPFVPNLRTIDWSLPDPKGQSLQTVGALRDEIHDRVKELIHTEWGECCRSRERRILTGKGVVIPLGPESCAGDTLGMGFNRLRPVGLLRCLARPVGHFYGCATRTPGLTTRSG